jgi:hypothetical protein
VIDPARRPPPPVQNARQRGHAGPPPPPRELPRPDPGERQFQHRGATWTARLSGKSAYGTGGYGLGLIEAVHFFDAAEPARPVREALLPRGRFELLYDAELAALLDGAVPITTGRQR